MASDRALPTAHGELRKRVVSAIILAPIALAAVVLGGIAFTVLVAAVAAIAFWEWTAMCGADEPPWARLLAGACLVAGLLALPFWGADWMVGLIVIPAFVSLLLGFLRRTFLWIGLGLIYVAVPCAGFIILRGAEPFGMAAIVFLLLVVWATDIGAYFGGRQFGGPKLWPAVSPKKTWSGAATGLVTAMTVGGLALLPTSASAAAGLLLAAPISIAAQAGDLLESAVKRTFDVKDSGHIIPGHGGVLDRVDGLFAAAALAWLIAAIGIGADILVLPSEIVAMSGGQP